MGFLESDGMILKIFCLAVISLLLAAPKAEAYLDPGVSSMIIQAFVAVVVAGGVFWRNILLFFKKIFKKGKK